MALFLRYHGRLNTLLQHRLTNYNLHFQSAAQELFLTQKLYQKMSPELISIDTFEELFESVQSGALTYGLVPFENS